jgi:beta-lactamase superfamily II metal-dependent hydrolase
MRDQKQEFCFIFSLYSDFMPLKILVTFYITFFSVFISPVRSQQSKQIDSSIVWKEGYLDLHHINTGRGSVAYYIFPDGTTMLFDAGEQDPTDERTKSTRNTTIRPNENKRPYEWITAYIKQVTPTDRKPVINYAILSHFHQDHMGSWYETAPKSSKGDYVLTGITGIADLLLIETLLDRGYPSYNLPQDMKSSAFEERLKTNPGTYKYWKTMNNYFSFINYREKQKLETGNLQPGSRNQVHLKYKSSRYPNFFVRNVKSNGRIWTGKDSSTVEHFTMFRRDDSKTHPSENALSQVITINYGDFRYYTGGDIPGNMGYGQPAWMDMETPVAKAVGPVDVATMDHHGNRDALNEFMVKTLRPRVWIEQVWSSDHPGHEVLIRATTPFLYDGPRDLFATNMVQANKDVIGPLIDRSYKSLQGHILVRVLPGGTSYYVIILDDTVETLKVKNVFGPYEVKRKSD